MSDEAFKELGDWLRDITPEEQQALLRAALRVQEDCPMCPVESQGLHRDPCYGCIILPNRLGQPLSTVN